jgi:hypothetical protein
MHPRPPVRANSVHHVSRTTTVPRRTRVPVGGDCPVTRSSSPLLRMPSEPQPESGRACAPRVPRRRHRRSMSRSVHVASRGLARRKSGTADRPPPRTSGDDVVPQPAPATTQKSHALPRMTRTDAGGRRLPVPPARRLAVARQSYGRPCGFRLRLSAVVAAFALSVAVRENGSRRHVAPLVSLLARSGRALRCRTPPVVPASPVIGDVSARLRRAYRHAGRPGSLERS